MCKRHKLILGYADPQCRECRRIHFWPQDALNFGKAYDKWRRAERARRIAEIRERNHEAT